MDPFCLSCVMFVFVMMYCMFISSLWSPAGKWLKSWLSCVLCFSVFSNLTICVVDPGQN